MEKLGSHWMDMYEIWYLKILRKSVEKIQVSLKSGQITATSHEDCNTFFIVSSSLLLSMRTVSDQSCKENQNAHYVFSNSFFFLNRVVYEIMWKNIVDLGRP
jgi:hypothetical protein